MLYARKNLSSAMQSPPATLDVTVFGPFKNRYKARMNDWMTLIPGKTDEIYNVSQISKDVSYVAFSMNNVDLVSRTPEYGLSKKLFS